MMLCKANQEKDSVNMTSFDCESNRLDSFLYIGIIE